MSNYICLCPFSLKKNIFRNLNCKKYLLNATHLEKYVVWCIEIKIIGEGLYYIRYYILNFKSKFAWYRNISILQFDIICNRNVRDSPLLLFHYYSFILFDIVITNCHSVLAQAFETRIMFSIHVQMHSYLYRYPFTIFRSIRQQDNCIKDIA